MIGLLALAAAIGVQPTPMAEPTVMIVEFVDRPSYMGVSAACDTEKNQEEQICLAELHEGQVTVLRHLSGPRVPPGQLLRLISHHMTVAPRPRMIVATRPFEDEGTKGNFAFWWDRPVEPGKYCVTDEEFKSWSADDPVRLVFAAGRLQHFRPASWDEAADFRCLTN